MKLAGTVSRSIRKSLSNGSAYQLWPAWRVLGWGLTPCLDVAHQVATGERETSPYRVQQYAPAVETAVASVAAAVEEVFPGVPNSRWVSHRLLNADDAVVEAVRSGELGQLHEDSEGAGTVVPVTDREHVLDTAGRLRWDLPSDFHDTVAERIYGAAQEITDAVQMKGLKKAGFDVDRMLDRVLTNRWSGFPLMLAILSAVFWLTIEGANVPSALLAGLLIDTIHPRLHSLGAAVSMPWWMAGFLFDGLYLATAWVVAVMLPPMAIFFPVFTLLEDFGYLPRVAFNLDSLFRVAGAHGKQALTMCMGFGCNAAGVVATRIIDSPREPSYRHHYQQLLVVQRAVADPDSGCLDLYRSGRASASGGARVGRRGGWHLGAWHRVHVRDLLVALAHCPARRGDEL